jgi:hypothetical protein
MYILEKDTIAEIIEKAFSAGREFQAQRDEGAIASRIEKARENVDDYEDIDDALFELKNCIENEFTDDACGNAGGNFALRIQADIMPDTSDDVGDDIEEVAEIASRPIMGNFERKERVAAILTALLGELH